jgi:hypothetical protein
MRFNPRSNKSIPLNKGLNQSISFLELGASELYSCINYELVDGAYAGLGSTNGYERYDGTPPASTVPVTFNSDGSISGDLVGNYYEGEEDRVAARDLIIPPDPVDSPSLSVFEYAGKLWTIKDNGVVNTIYWTELDGSALVGWDNSLPLTGSVGTPDTPNGAYSYTKGRIQELHGNDEIIVLCNGLDNAWVLYDDKAGSVTLEQIIHPNLPASTFPKLTMIWNQRLFLGYEKGNLFFSATGLDVVNDPDAWDPSVAPAGQLYYEDELTNLIVTPSSMVVFCENQIKVLKNSNIDPATGVDFIGDTYSPTSGAIWGTAQRILGTVLFCDDRGISTLATTAAYGDFSANVISKNIQRTYLEIKSIIIGSSVDREKNQYKVILPNGGIVVTFKGKDELKGITLFNYSDEISVVYESKWFGGAGGTVYRVAGDVHSFDCEIIPGLVRTSYFTYNSPSRWKQFKRLLFELQASKGTEILISPSYDYANLSSPKPSSSDMNTSKFFSGSPWGSSIWKDLNDPNSNFFIWGSSVQSQGFHYITGTGTNMSVGFTTKDKYHETITFYNMQVTYTQNNMDF